MNYVLMTFWGPSHVAVPWDAGHWWGVTELVLAKDGVVGTYLSGRVERPEGSGPELSRLVQ